MPEPYTVLHGGFHKTATTFLQGILKRNQSHLAKRGVHYVHHRDMRKDFTVPCQLNAYMHFGMKRKTIVTDEALRELTGEFFNQALANKPARLILSDENMAGHCGQCVRRGTLYRFRRRFIGTFAREIPIPVREVHLAIRNYADFFASAYIENLRSIQNDTPMARFVTEEQMKHELLSRMPSWYIALKDARSFFPKARFYIWKYEDFRAVLPIVLKNLCGSDIEIDKLKHPSKGKQRPSTSARAVIEMLQIAQTEGLEAMVGRRIAIQEDFPRGETWSGYDPWTEQERRHLTKTYERDWAKIEKSPDFETVVPA